MMAVWQTQTTAMAVIWQSAEVGNPCHSRRDTLSLRQFAAQPFDLEHYLYLLPKRMLIGTIPD
jgi:hypothetical protein